MKNDVVIIGAGHAGGMTAISLRQQKYQGSITLIGEEDFRNCISRVKGFLHANGTVHPRGKLLSIPHPNRTTPHGGLVTTTNENHPTHHSDSPRP